MADNKYSKLGSKLKKSFDELSEKAANNELLQKASSLGKKDVSKSNDVEKETNETATKKSNKTVRKDKYCISCGKKIGVFGERKLADGRLCRECSEKYAKFIKSSSISLPSTTFEELKQGYEEYNKNKYKFFSFWKTKKKQEPQWSLTSFLNKVKELISLKVVKQVGISIVALVILALYGTSSSNLNVFKGLIINNDQRRNELTTLMAEEVNEALYTPATMDEYYKAFETANAVMNTTIIDQSKIDIATENLKRALSNLVIKADKSKLIYLLEYYSGIDISPYTSSTVYAFQTALSEGQKANDDANIDQKSVDAVLSSIQDTYFGLEKKGNVSALMALLSDYSNIDESEYIPNLYADFDKMMKEANKAVDSDDMNQQQIDNIAELLTESYNALEKKPDKTGLISLVNTCSNMEQGIYTDDTWKAFEASLSAAKSTVDNENATLSQVKEATNYLNNARKSLKKYTKGVYEITVSCNLYENNQGGEEFYYYLYLNNSLKEEGAFDYHNSFEETETVTYAFGTKVTIKCRIIEDDNIPDVGTGSVTITLVDGYETSFKVYVKENRGKNAGKAAIFVVTVSVKLDHME